MSDWWDGSNGQSAPKPNKQSAQPAPPAGAYAEAEWEPGKWFAVAIDNHHRANLEERARATGRKHYSVWTVAELATLIRSIPIVTSIKDLFPGAEVLPPRLPPVGRVPKDDLGPILEPEPADAEAEA